MFAAFVSLFFSQTLYSPEVANTIHRFQIRAFPAYVTTFCLTQSGKGALRLLSEGGFLDEATLFSDDSARAVIINIMIIIIINIINSIIVIVWLSTQ